MKELMLSSMLAVGGYGGTLPTGAHSGRIVGDVTAESAFPVHLQEDTTAEWLHSTLQHSLSKDVTRSIS